MAGLQVGGAFDMGDSGLACLYGVFEGVQVGLEFIESGLLLLAHAGERVPTCGERAEFEMLQARIEGL